MKLRWMRVRFGGEKMVYMPNLVGLGLCPPAGWAKNWMFFFVCLLARY